MARLGKLPVKIAEGVTVTITDDVIEVKGPKGSLKRNLTRDVNVIEKNKEIFVEPRGNSKKSNVMQGTTRAHIANMVKGAAEGWKKQLEINGPGYRAEVRGKELVMTLGFSHPVVIEALENMTFLVEKNVITVEGPDKEDVGHIAALVRAARKPNVYTGSGVKYADEIIRRKAGKQAGSE